MNSKKLAKFKSLVSDKKSDYLLNEIDKQKRLIQARIAFKMLDFMTSSNPKVTREQFGTKMGGCSKQYVSKLVRGKENMTAETMQKIAYAMGIQFHELVQPPIEVENPSGAIECISNVHYAKLAILYLKMNDMKSIYLSNPKYDQEVSY